VYGEDVAAPGVPRIVEIVVVGERGTGEGHAERGAAHVPESVPAEPSPMTPMRRSPPRDERELRHLARRGATGAERRGALTALAHRRPGRDTVALLTGALDDPDEQVRAVALHHLAALPDAPPATELARVARADTSPHLRRRALDLLAGMRAAETERALHHALSDPDREIREHAEALLENVLHTAGRARPEAP
jgi:hypothetical protein